MKIEVGKFYKTRAGHKARIYAIDGDGNYPVHGSIAIHSGWAVYVWTEEGLISLAANVLSDFNIVAEWEEPKAKISLWMNECTGQVRAGRGLVSLIGEGTWSQVTLKDLE